MSAVEEAIRENGPYLDRLAAITADTTSPFIISTDDTIQIDSDLNDVKLVDSQLYDINFLKDKQTDKTVERAIGFFVLEAQGTAKLLQLLKEGNEIATMLYSYRSVSRAIPQVQPDDPRKAEHYRKQYEILLPEIEKMKKFMTFRDLAIAKLSDVFKAVIPEAKDKQSSFSSDFITVLAEVLDMFIRMDALKNIKSSMNNDFSMYRRAVPNIPGLSVNEEETITQHMLYNFLANNDQYSAELKKSLSKLSFPSEDVIIDVLQTCADRLEAANQRPIFYEQKHCLLRVIAFCIFLLDGPTPEEDITKKKKLKLDRYVKLFKQTPVVTLFADLSLNLSMIYKKAPHLKDVKWDDVDEKAKRELAEQYSMLNVLDSIRSEHTQLMTFISKIHANFTSTNHKSSATTSTPLLSPEEEGIVVQTLLRGISLLAKASATVHEQVAWKYNNPVTPDAKNEIQEDALPYELSVRYNYSNEEKKALIEYIFIIKSLSNRLIRLHNTYAASISRHIYKEIQEFTHIPLTDIIQHCIKKKKTLAGYLKHVRDITGDGPFAEDEVKKGKTKGPNDNFNAVTKSRLSPISPTQIHFSRKLVEYIFTERGGKGAKGSLLQQKDFKDSQTNDMLQFINNTWNYEILLNFNSNVRKLANLSDLWYKEFYLELSKKVQFPIDCSLPYILIEFIRSSNDPQLQSYILYAYELYNDAARKALFELKCRYIYDEITAEVNLAFDVTMYGFSEKMYTHFKRIASERIISPEFKPDDFISPVRGLPVQIYDDFLAQREASILGRSIDINNVFANLFQAHLQSSLDVAFARLEANELSYVVDFDALIEVNKETHRLISQRVRLPPFEELFAQADDSVSLVAANGKFISYFLRELVFDVAPNFCYNNITERFFRTPNTYVGEYNRPSAGKALPKDLFGNRSLHTAFVAQNSVAYKFIGTNHFQIVLKYIKRKGIPVILNEIIRRLNVLVRDQLTPYIAVVGKGIPAALKLPLFEYGVQGTFDYFSIQLNPLISYPDIASKVFQTFRELGNYIIIVKRLEDNLNVRDIFFDIQNTGTVLNSMGGNEPTISLTVASDSKIRTSGENQEWDLYFENIVKKTKSVYADSHATVLVAKLLIHLKNILYSLENEWQALGALDNPRAFFRLWSAIQFVFSLSSVGKGSTIRELFGDGLAWGGCTLISLYGQYHNFRAFDFNSHILTVQTADKKLGNLHFGNGQYGGALQPGMSIPSSVTNAAQQEANNEKNSQAMQVSILAAASNAGAASELRIEVVQFLENATFYNDLNEEIFATLEGLQAVALE